MRLSVDPAVLRAAAAMLWSLVDEVSPEPVGVCMPGWGFASDALECGFARQVAVAATRRRMGRLAVSLAKAASLVQERDAQTATAFVGLSEGGVTMGPEAERIVVDTDVLGQSAHDLALDAASMSEAVEGWHRGNVQMLDDWQGLTATAASETASALVVRLRGQVATLDGAAQRLLRVGEDWAELIVFLDALWDEG